MALLLLLLLLLAYALASAALLPNAFAGLPVWPQRVDPLLPEMVPLRFGTGNVTQSLYLAMNVTAAVIGALFLTRGAIPCRSVLVACLAGAYLVVALRVWQLGARLGGLPFPSDLLYSNPRWAIVEQSLGPVPRIQGPFAEPSALGFYMSGMAFCCLWMRARGATRSCGRSSCSGCRC